MDTFAASAPAIDLLRNHGRVPLTRHGTILWLLLATVFCWVPRGMALDAIDYTVQVTATVSTVPPRIILNWTPDDQARTFTIRRKLKTDNDWSGPLAVLPGTATTFTDSNVSVGAAFEYEMEEATTIYPYPNGDPSGWVTAYGYIYAGVAATINDLPGKVLLLVDATYAADLAPELQQLASDLVGDGWVVTRRDVARSSRVTDVKAVVRDEYNADPANLKALFLIGHIPVPYSGLINPDMHDGHLGAWPADLYYGDIDGTWTDNSVNKTDSEDPRNDNVPGDGKFDQSNIPSPVELQVGRVDMYDLPAFSPRSEKDLLRQYLIKDHNYRQKLVTTERRGLIRDNFGDLSGDAPAVDAWRHFIPFFGLSNIRVANAGEYFPILNSESYLWSYACGGGANDKADGVGTTDDFASSDIKSVFLMLHGSYFGDWDVTDNFLRAAIATPTYSLAAIWTGLPHWFMHHMALGETIGFSTRLTQNNDHQLYKSRYNFSAGQVHVALLGDPTLRMDVVAPPRNITARVTSSLVINWDTPPETVDGYNVYQSGGPDGPFTKLNAAPISGTTFMRRGTGSGQNTYMVRAVKLQTSPSGTYYNLSQGIFTTVTQSDQSLPSISVTATDTEASETGDTGIFNISRGGDVTAPLQIFFVTAGTAQNGIDYDDLGSGATIPAGASSISLMVRPKSDDLVEGDETVILVLGSSANYNIASPGSAQVTIHDTPQNSPPTANAQSVSLIENSTAAITLTGADPENQSLRFTLGSAPTNGYLGGELPNLIYHPFTNYFGKDSFTFLVNDGLADSAAATVDITVQPIGKMDQPIHLSNGSVLLRFTAFAGRTYRISATSGLGDNWQVITETTATSDGTAEYTDADAPRFPERIYRVEWP